MDRAMRSWLLTWISAAEARGATVVVATHDIEPFVDLAKRALVVADGTPALHDPLPAERDARAQCLDQWARGSEANSPSPSTSR